MLREIAGYGSFRARREHMVDIHSLQGEPSTAVSQASFALHSATPAELKERPANLFVGTFIGEPPMNVFPSRVRKENGRLDFVRKYDVDTAPARTQYWMGIVGLD
jgi:ABC-type sugar transport system ATPase subunit